MIVKPAVQTPPQVLSEGVTMRWVIAAADGAENFFMRLVDVAAEAAPPPPHQHPFEHEMYILAGQGVAIGPDGETLFTAGDVIFVPPDESHQLRHDTTLKFICLIPASGAASAGCPPEATS